MNRANVALAVDLMRRVCASEKASANFDMRSFFGSSTRAAVLSDVGDCGTSACLAGWMAQDPACLAAGFNPLAAGLSFYGMGTQSALLYGLRFFFDAEIETEEDVEDSYATPMVARLFGILMRRQNGWIYSSRTPSAREVLSVLEYMLETGKIPRDIPESQIAPEPAAAPREEWLAP